MPQQFDPAALQQYYSIAMGQPMAQPMVNQEQINPYNQQTIPVAVPVPEIQNYAPQQFQPQVQAPQQQNPQFQIQKQRMDYAAMIEQRFNEIADHVGGINALVQTNNLDAARKKAADDIGMMFGPPPAIEQPMTELERVQLEKEKLSLKQAQKALGKVATEQAKIETDKFKSAQENIGLASDVVSSVDKLLANENALQWAGGVSGKMFGVYPGEVRGTKQQIDQLRDQIGLFGRKAIVGQGQGSISDAEQKMAKEALSQVITEGTDEQLIQSLKAVRQKFGGILDRIQAEASNAQPAGQPMAQPAGQPKVRTFVPGKGFQD